MPDWQFTTLYVSAKARRRAQSRVLEPLRKLDIDPLLILRSFGYRPDRLPPAGFALLIRQPQTPSPFDDHRGCSLDPRSAKLFFAPPWE
jgi:hypothetical protein